MNHVGRHRAEHRVVDHVDEIAGGDQPQHPPMDRPHARIIHCVADIGLDRLRHALPPPCPRPLPCGHRIVFRLNVACGAPTVMRRAEFDRAERRGAFRSCDGGGMRCASPSYAGRAVIAGDAATQQSPPGIAAGRHARTDASQRRKPTCACKQDRYRHRGGFRHGPRRSAALREGRRGGRRGGSGRRRSQAVVRQITDERRQGDGAGRRPHQRRFRPRHRAADRAAVRRTGFRVEPCRHAGSRLDRGHRLEGFRLRDER